MSEADITQISNFNEEHKSKIVHRRRSSIFRTRVATCSQYEDKNTKNETRLISNLNKENIDIETFNLKEYIEKLRQEQKDWQQEYRKRKNQRRNLIKHKANVEAQGQVLDMDVLTESERAFLIARPNYEHICRNTQKLLDMTLKVSIVSQLIHKSNQRFMDRMEKNISTATRNIIKISKK